jgi:2-polyprenyl-3-methyl-5-hydroxy-6-metoxy-1,4-benzoquinol methylase
MLYDWCEYTYYWWKYFLRGIKLIDKLLTCIYNKNNYQKKKLDKLFESRPAIKSELADFLEDYQEYMRISGIEITELCEAYITLLSQMMHARIHFMRTGEYPHDSQESTIDDIYSNDVFMKRYMLGLAVSQFLWEHHYEIFSFYSNYVKTLGECKNVLEVGCGHGLFIKKFLETVVINDSLSVDMVDISKASITATREILSTITFEKTPNFSYIHDDIINFDGSKKYDFIIMGEVLEHVERPDIILKKLYSLLSENGRLFISTCANCPAVDHIYYFENGDAIRLLLKDAGFSIEKEVLASSENISLEDAELKKIDIIYAAILKRSE